MYLEFATRCVSETPVHAGEYDEALHIDHPEAPSLLDQYLANQPKPEPKLGGSLNKLQSLNQSMA